VSDYTLITPAGEDAWRAYHDIRRIVLFEARGQFGVYDPDMPDDSLPDNHAKLLLYRDDPIGVVRIDIDGTRALLRRVAIREDAQRRGHGRALISMVEEFALAHGCRRLTSHVGVGAVGFYQKCGFTVDEPGSDSVVMSKTIGKSA
jgi:GNAT superfamily N-acetyltransferase